MNDGRAWPADLKLVHECLLMRKNDFQARVDTVPVHSATEDSRATTETGPGKFDTRWTGLNGKSDFYDVEFYCFP